MKQIEIELPAYWASALVNGDWSCVDYYGAWLGVEIKAWLDANPNVSIHSCSDQSYISRYRGLQCDMCTYYGVIDV